MSTFRSVFHMDGAECILETLLSRHIPTAQTQPGERRPYGEMEEGAQRMTLPVRAYVFGFPHAEMQQMAEKSSEMRTRDEKDENVSLVHRGWVVSYDDDGVSHHLQSPSCHWVVP